MSEHLEDDEQVEALKRWWQENGRSTVAAVVLAIAGTVGWQQYQGWDLARTEAASDAWDVVSVALDSADPELRTQATVQAELLIDEYSGSSYARYAAMKLAALAVAERDFGSAEAHLRQALTSGPSDSALTELIELRLARVLAAKGDEQGALAILEAGSVTYPVAYSAALGDIHLAAGREAQALTAYKTARQAGLELGAPPGLLDAKITSLETRLAGTENAS